VSTEVCSWMNGTGCPWTNVMMGVMVTIAARNVMGKSILVLLFEDQRCQDVKMSKCQDGKLRAWRVRRRECGIARLRMYGRVRKRREN
jgi:hypothetical protein